METRICYYASDHGYGHAARSIAVMRALLEKFEDVRIYVKNYSAYDFLKNSIQHPRLEAICRKNDIGIISIKDSLETDKEGTRNALLSWIGSWDNYINDEMRFLQEKNISFVITDASPQPLIAASRQGIPSAIISNFTWHNIYSGIFRNELQPELDMLKQAYDSAGTAFVLPFEQEFSAASKYPVGLVARNVSRNRRDMRQSLGIAEDEFLVYYGVGFSLDMLKLSSLVLPPKMRLVVSSNCGFCSNDVLQIPAGYTETQNYIAMCDLAVIKSGYSTVAEAICAKVPMLITAREGFSDDKVISDSVETMGIGRQISNSSFMNRGWISAARQTAVELKQNYEHIPERFKNSGIPRIMEGIGNIIRRQ